MNTPQLVRLCLQHYRSQGLPFAEAWARALQAIPRGPNVEVVRTRAEWLPVLKWSRSAWQAAYERSDLLSPLGAPGGETAPAHDLALTG